MFADISGFTNLTETLSKLGSEGAELTAFAINRYMELLVKTVSKSGGDIFKFAGGIRMYANEDAMIVVWPPSTKTDQIQQYLEVGTFCRMAIQSALEIQARLDDTAILENIRLSVKIGFGVGDINIIYVGGVFGRSEYLATGEPLKQAFQSEHYADRGG
jgi:adenylate cyclase 10